MRLQDYIYEKPVLETERLTLRTMTSADTADLKEWLSDNSLYQYWGKHPGKSDLSPEILFQKKEKPTKSFHWGVVHNKDKPVRSGIWYRPKSVL